MRIFSRVCHPASQRSLDSRFIQLAIVQPKPLRRGKLLNVRDASAAQITGNAEIQNIKQILGLQHGKVYSDAKSLRYGHLMIMTDQVRVQPGNSAQSEPVCV